MFDIATLKIGDRVCYAPKNYGPGEYENGRVKEIPQFSNSAVRVVYHCAGDWDHFSDYTSALTDIESLELGWRHR